MKRASSRRANLNLTLEIVLGSASLVAFMSVDADMFKVCFPWKQKLPHISLIVHTPKKENSHAFTINSF